MKLHLLFCSTKGRTCPFDQFVASQNDPARPNNGSPHPLKESLTTSTGGPAGHPLVG